MVSITIWGVLAVITVIYLMISGKGINVFNKGYQEVEGSKAKAQGIFMLFAGIGILIIAFINR
jgi:hypothetical protein